MKTKFFLAFAFLVVASVLTSCGDKDEPVDDGQWIDPVFARYLEKNGYIKDASIVTPVEVSDITDLYIDSNDIITSLKGIEYFISLKVLHCCYCEHVTSLNLSKNTQLTILRCYGNQLKALNINGCTKLEELYCWENQLTQLDLSKNTHLTDLWCSENQLRALNINGCTQLEELSCGGNQLTQLDVSKNAQLTDLGCDGNQLTKLDISKNAQLARLYCDSNQLTQLDISQNTALKSFSCLDNPGANGLFRVKAWFDNSNVPSTITNDPYYASSWTYNGSTVTIDYYK